MLKVLTHRPFKPHFVVIRIHFTPPPSFTTPLPPTNVVVCFGKSFTVILQHWMGEGGVFVEGSEFYKGVIIMAKKKCHVESMCQLLFTLIVRALFV